MRGTLPCHVTEFETGGIIPAHAGNASNRSGAGAHTRDHPRACGEHAYSPDGTRGCGGSSPRMRGTLWVSSVGLSPVRDHPRACGEHDREVEHVAAAKGSSPRMRGTLVGSKTPHCPSGDHPRACGEHRRVECCPHLRSGSSPRMRGTRSGRHRRPDRRGIIPAHAGNTFGHRTAPTVHGDHPRACGEHPSTSASMAAMEGSSPRMRGTLGELVSDCLRMGIIPAHAGNTILSRDGAWDELDHPRACGEHGNRRPREVSVWGSSPRMRGTLANNIGLAIDPGIIPAHAGNTYGEPHHDLAGGDHPRACGEHCMSRNHPRT